MNVDPRLLRQARIARAAMLLTLFFGVGGGALVILQAGNLSAVIARVFLAGQTLSQVAGMLRWLLVIILLRAGTTIGGEVAANAVAVRVKAGLRQLLLEKFIRLGPAYQTRHESGDLAAAALQGVENLDAYFSQYLPQIVLAAVIPLAVLAAVFPRDLLSGLILLVTMPLIPVFMVLIGKLAEVLTNRQFTALQRMSAFFLDTMQGLTTLKAMGQSANQTEKIKTVSERYRLATMSVLQTTFLSALVLEWVGTLSTAVVAVEIGLRVLYGRLGFEQALFVLIIAPEFYLPLRMLGQRFHAGMAGVAAARKIFEVLDTPENAARSQSRSIHRDAVDEAAWIDRPICFEAVSFQFPGRDEAALKDISFCIQPGEMIAVVGRSGSGKSTLAHLLLGFIQPTQGKIRAGYQRMQDIPIEAWRQQIAWVSQQPVLFSGSLLDNMRIAKSDAKPLEITKAAEAAGLLEVLDHLPQGWDTPVGEGGMRLSGGQGQRLALARAFLRNKPFLVLDEPTARLDPQREQQLAEATRQLCVGRTVFVIAHRLQTVREADNILVLESGRLVEMGDHSELVRLKGAYARLLQAGQEGG